MGGVDWGGGDAGGGAAGGDQMGGDAGAILRDVPEMVREAGAGEIERRGWRGVSAGDGKQAVWGDREGRAGGGIGDAVLGYLPGGVCGVRLDADVFDG